MKGFINRYTAGLWVSAVLCLAAWQAGCQPLKYHVCDPCYPERYWYEARHNYRHLYANQTNNGHVLDQTVWNYHFEKDYKKDPETGNWSSSPTAKLNQMGVEHLQYLVRRRPKADPKLYLQTSVDVAYNPAIAPEEMANLRAHLDKERMASINHFLVAHLRNRHHEYAFQIVVHDPGDVTIAATPIGGNVGPVLIPGAVAQMYANFQGLIAIGGGGAAVGGGGTGGSGASTGDSGSGGF